MENGTAMNVRPFVVGWESILPELKAFFIALKVRKEQEVSDFLPLNIFLSGRIGMNKSSGIVHLARSLGLTSDCVDCSTIDDAAELAGIVNLYALREKGELQVARGEFLDNDLPVLDEFLNSRPHVLPQFRLLLQRKFNLHGRPVPMLLNGLAATANLSDDMDAGEANVLDSPTADRFAMLVCVPASKDLSREEKIHIINRDGSNGFEKALTSAVNRAVGRFKEEGFIKQFNDPVTNYVLTVQENLKGTPFQFEMRRAQVLKMLLLSVCASGDTQTSINADDTLRVMRACLSVPKLTGMELDMQRLVNAHREAQMYLVLDKRIRAIYDASDPQEKVKQMLKARHEIDFTIQLDICREVSEHGDVATRLALAELLCNSQTFGGSAEFKDLGRRVVKRIKDDFPNPQLPDSYQSLKEEYGELTVSQIVISRCSEGSVKNCKKILNGVRKILKEWKNAA